MTVLTILSISPLLCLLMTIYFIHKKGGFPSFFIWPKNLFQNRRSSLSTYDTDNSSKNFFLSIIDGCLIWSLALWAQTNLLSLFNLIYPVYIIGFWLIYLLLLTILLIFSPSHETEIHPPRSKLPIPLYLLCSFCLVIAIIYPPNNWDAQSYHLPRVMQWLQNHSLSSFSTNIPRQVGMPPFNSMVALQIMGFDGSDYFVNLIQWLAYIGCIIGVYTLTGLFGDKRVQIYAAIFMACMPGAIKQATTFESTLLVSFWLVAFVYCFMLWRQNPSWPLSLKIGLCLGLAILSKGSAYPIALAFVIFIAYLCLRHPSKRFLQGCLMALVIILLNIPHLARTYEAYGDVFGGTQTNILHHPSTGTFIVNTVYNFLVHEPWLITITGDTFYKLPEYVGVDAGDPEIFPWKGLEKTPKKITFNEGYGENPLGAAFLLVMLLAIIFYKFKPPLLYTCLLGFSWGAYFLLLTWHPWTGRIHTSLFILASPLAGLFINSWRNASFQKAMIIILFLYALLPLNLDMRPLFNIASNQHILSNNRESLYIPSASIRDSQMKALNFLAAQSPASLGIIEADNSLEYPIWRALRKNSAFKPKVIHLKDLEDKAKPQFVWVQEANTNDELLSPKILRLDNGVYKQIFPSNKS